MAATQINVDPTGRTVPLVPGQGVTFRARFYTDPTNIAGTLVDPATVTYKQVNPDGSHVEITTTAASSWLDGVQGSQTLKRVGVGTFTVTWTAVARQTFGRFEGTANAQGAGEAAREFYVLVDPTDLF